MYCDIMALYTVHVVCCTKGSDRSNHMSQTLNNVVTKYVVWLLSDNMYFICPTLVTLAHELAVLDLTLALALALALALNLNLAPHLVALVAVIAPIALVWPV